MRPVRHIDAIRAVTGLEPDVAASIAKTDRSLGVTKRFLPMTGAALMMMDYNGTNKVSHHKEKVINMIHMAETLYGCREGSR